MGGGGWRTAGVGDHNGHTVPSPLSPPSPPSPLLPRLPGADDAQVTNQSPDRRESLMASLMRDP